MKAKNSSLMATVFLHLHIFYEKYYLYLLNCVIVNSLYICYYMYEKVIFIYCYIYILFRYINVSLERRTK